MTADQKGRPTASGKRKAGGGTKRGAASRKVATSKKSKTTAMPKASTKDKPAGKEEPAADQPKVVESPAVTKKQVPAASEAAAPRPARSGAAPSWQPRIVVFACNWCSYAGADTAGVSRIQHQANFRMIRVMCSGRIQPAFVLRAFEKGADGVLVSGCHFGDCHYIFGNERAVEQFAKTMNMVKLLGVEEARLRLEWISAAEGVRFAQVINEFTDQVRELGPSPFARHGSARQLVDQTEDVA